MTRIGTFEFPPTTVVESEGRMGKLFSSPELCLASAFGLCKPVEIGISKRLGLSKLYKPLQIVSILNVRILAYVPVVFSSIWIINGKLNPSKMFY